MLDLPVGARGVTSWKITFWASDTQLRFSECVFMYMLHTYHVVLTVVGVSRNVGSGRRVVPRWRGLRRCHFRARALGPRASPRRGLTPDALAAAGAREGRPGGQADFALEDIACPMLMCVDTFCILHSWG